MDKNGCLLVSWDFNNGEGHELVLVGSKIPGKDVDIINAFQGKEAVEIFEKLTRKNKK